MNVKKIIATAAATVGIALVAPLALATPAEAATVKKYKRGTTFSAPALVGAMDQTATMAVTYKGKTVASGVSKYKARKKGVYTFAVTYKPSDLAVSKTDCRVASESIIADRTSLTESGNYRHGQVDTAYVLNCVADVNYAIDWDRNITGTQQVAFQIQTTETNSIYDPASTPLLDSNEYVIGDVFYGVDSYEYLPKITVSAKRIVR